MSCYGWEAGEIKLSAAEYKKFRDAFVATWNAERARDSVTATAIHREIVEAGKGIKGFDYWRACRDAYVRMRPSSGRYGSVVEPEALKTMDFEHLSQLMLERFVITDEARQWGRYERLDKPSAPAKKDFATVPPTKAAQVRAGPAGMITFEPATRTVHWSVSENNRAVDHARESFVGRLFFSMLKRVTWTRGTGGTIYGNDEHNRERARDAGPGSGGNTVNDAFGPIGEKAQEDRLRAMGLKVPRKRAPAPSPMRRW